MQERKIKPYHSRHLRTMQSQGSEMVCCWQMCWLGDQLLT